MSPYNSFIVRVWTDESVGQHRGQIQHVGTQETLYFANNNEMNDFIERHLEPPSINIGEANINIQTDMLMTSNEMRTSL